MENLQNLFNFDYLNFPLVFSIGGFCGFLFGFYLKSRGTSSATLEQEIEYGTKSDNYRMILGVRTDLKMQKGKVAAQCAHAAVGAYANCSKKAPGVLQAWQSSGQAKITVKIDSEEEMLELDRKAKSMGILTCVIRDAGHTQVAPNTRTVVAFGPAPKNIIDKLTGHLKLY